LKLNDYLPQAPEITFENVQLDSRKVTRGSVFFALPGQKTDGSLFVKDAIQKGAVAIVAGPETNLQADVPVITVENIYLTLAKINNDIYDNPARYLTCYGVTGTDGKTTTTQIIYQLLRNVEESSYIGTIGVETRDSLHNLGCTTPLATDLYREVDRLRSKKTQSLSIEVSSHALAQHRAEYIRLDVAAFTNVVSEHLDFHGTLENYVAAKRSLINLVRASGTVLLNTDDQHFDDFRQYAYSKNLKTVSYGIKYPADYMATNIQAKATGISFDLIWSQNHYPVSIQLIGLFNVYNCLAAIASVTQTGHDIRTMIKYLEQINGIYGRNVFVHEGQNFQVFLDFAHTPNAILLLLEYLRETCDKEKRKMTVVTGAAGDRDPGKRQPIGRLATTFGDRVIFTDEDPGTEDPGAIMRAILSGAVRDNYQVIHDRKTAVRYALDTAGENDMVVMLGKAGMTYDMVGEEKIPYNEIDFVKEYLRSKNQAL